MKPGEAPRREDGDEVRYDGRSATDVAVQCEVPHVSLHASVDSTMDVAHALAQSGADAGTLVLSDRQATGRGRNGRAWHSVPGESLTFTVIERPPRADAVGVLSLRIGIALARCLDPYATAAVGIKWPNDLQIGGEKLLGVLVEARWRHTAPEWVAIGVGLNLRPPAGLQAAGLAPGTSRVEILSRMVPVIRAAAASTGSLTTEELRDFAARDRARGRRLREPASGVARGITPDGALIVEAEHGTVVCLSGSLVFAEE